MLNQEQQNTINEAVSILGTLFQTSDEAFTSPTMVAKFCQLQIAHLEHEVFAVMFLNTSYKLIDFKVMFRGTIDAASVYPREVAKEALIQNAAAVILSHNHPSGDTQPSAADQRITSRLAEALGLLDIRILDHIVVSTTQTTSFAERGLL